MVKKKKAIVHGVVTKFRSNIANVDVFQRLVGLQITNLNHKWVGSIALAIDDELGHDYGMVCGTSKGSNPPFRRRQVW